jgi:hypothetical protein
MSSPFSRIFPEQKLFDLKADLEVELGKMVLLLPILVLGVGDEPADLALVARGPFAAEPCVLLRVECVPIVFRHFRSCALKKNIFGGEKTEASYSETISNKSV